MVLESGLELSEMYYMYFDRVFSKYLDLSREQMKNEVCYLTRNFATYAGLLRTIMTLKSMC
jgi:hypothetical protein